MIRSPVGKVLYDSLPSEPTQAHSLRGLPDVDARPGAEVGAAGDSQSSNAASAVQSHVTLADELSFTVAAT